MPKNVKKSNLKKNVFYDFKSAMLYAEALMDATNNTFIGTVAEQIYKDSNEFTYRESGDMYKSGELLSKFNQGIITERTPYARRRYYEGGKAGAGNPKAQPRWFEKTVANYGDNYKKQWGKILEEKK